MRVYRIEHGETGIGPLCARQPNYSISWFELFHDHNSPDTYAEYLKFANKHKMHYDNDNFQYVFGMECLDRLFGLLKENAFDTLEEYGFVLREFEVKNDYVVLPDGQVVFDRDQAIIVG